MKFAIIYVVSKKPKDNNSNVSFHLTFSAKIWGIKKKRDCGPTISSSDSFKKLEFFSPAQLEVIKKENKFLILMVKNVCFSN